MELLLMSLLKVARIVVSDVYNGLEDKSFQAVGQDVVLAELAKMQRNSSR